MRGEGRRPLRQRRWGSGVAAGRRAWARCRRAQTVTGDGEGLGGGDPDIVASNSSQTPFKGIWYLEKIVEIIDSGRVRKAQTRPGNPPPGEHMQVTCVAMGG